MSIDYKKMYDELVDYAKSVEKKAKVNYRDPCNSHGDDRFYYGNECGARSVIDFAKQQKKAIGIDE